MSTKSNYIKFRFEDFKLMNLYYPDLSFIKKVYYCWLKDKYQKKYNFAHMEFFTGHLGEKKESEVKEFYPRKLQATLYNKVNPIQIISLTKDKFASYQKLKQFYKRKICAFNPSPSQDVKYAYKAYDWKNDILEFLKNHLNYIIKPIDGSCGVGVQIIHNTQFYDPNELLNQYLKAYPGGFVLEELINQHEALAKYHPTSVNTLRINSFNMGNGTIDLRFPCYRVGRKNAVVDNAGSGGIMAAIDVNSGKMISAADEEGYFYNEHPDSHIKFDGQIPFWNELLSFATSIAQNIPELKIAGLDLALDKERGWTLIEINYQPYMIYEIAAQKGIRAYMEEFERKFDNPIS